MVHLQAAHTDDRGEEALESEIGRQESVRDCDFDWSDAHWPEEEQENEPAKNKKIDSVNRAGEVKVGGQRRPDTSLRQSALEHP